MGETEETCSDLHSRLIILAAGRRKDCRDLTVEIRKQFRNDGRDREVDVLVSSTGIQDTFPN